MNGGYDEDYPDPKNHDDIPMDHFRKQHLDTFERAFPELYGKWIAKTKIKSDLLPYFAAHALTGLLAKGGPSKEAYELSWEIADEMVRIGVRRGSL